MKYYVKLFEFPTRRWYYESNIILELCPGMTNWQITAKTIFCDSVDDEVTLMVYKNGSVHCTGCQKYNQPNSITLQLIREKTRRLKRPIKCEGEPCPRLTVYQQKILSEEAQ
jgi:hypothetical protein